jgi:hypothetical protein
MFGNEFSWASSRERILFRPAISRVFVMSPAQTKIIPISTKFFFSLEGSSRAIQ